MPQKTYKSPAPGAPGIPGKWTNSSKSGIGKSLSSYSQVSFTTSHGILNEVYYPREDNACIRDMELLVTKDGDFFAEEKRDTRHETAMIETGIPCYKVTNTGLDTLYKIHKEIITDPLHNTVLQKIKFEPITGKKDDFQLYVLLAPHISNQSAENMGWLDEYKGVPMLFAERDGITLALACSLPWKKRSVGFVGVSEGYTDISTHKSMQWEYDRADSGNLALTGEIDISSEDEFTLALAFGRDMNEAAQHAHASLLKGFDGCKQLYVKQWSDWHQSIDERKDKDIKSGKLFRNSVAIMRMHESFHFSGAVIASLSIPWGNTKGDGDIGGYHVVWPRDLVECSSGFLAFNAREDALRVMNYLMATQEADGHWPQNMWLEGKPYWDGLQLDQIAFPILLIGRYKKDNGLTEHESKVAWQTVRRAAGFLLRYGPLSPQERWEEESGISVSTIATCIAALLVAAEMADEYKDSRLGKYCREEADYWNSQIENWLYVKHTPMANEAGVEGYYIRINPTGCLAKDLDGQIIGLKNRPDDEKNVPVNELVSVDALALVRFGLRSAKDPKILNTIKVIDAKLKVETPHGPCWHRYNNDGYGEHEDGSAFDGTGIGRAWPLLTGERAHYEVAAGNIKGAQALMKTMEGFASHELFPEQIWDANDIVAKNLYLGSHSGSAIPLVWAHAEYVKLCASVSQKKVFDMPDHTIERYIKNKNESNFDIWRFMLPCPFIKKGNTLRIITEVSATVSWSVDNWEHVQQKDAIDGGFGIHYIDVPVDAFDGESVVFTFYWTDAQHWENKNYEIKIIK
ncbi:glycoside hydrolase family 15 protein [Mucilaginibacter sp.]